MPGCQNCCNTTFRILAKLQGARGLAECAVCYHPHLFRENGNGTLTVDGFLTEHPVLQTFTRTIVGTGTTIPPHWQPQRPPIQTLTIRYRWPDLQHFGAMIMGELPHDMVLLSCGCRVKRARLAGREIA